MYESGCILWLGVILSRSDVLQYFLCLERIKIRETCIRRYTGQERKVLCLSSCYQSFCCVTLIYALCFFTIIKLTKATRRRVWKEGGLEGEDWRGWYFLEREVCVETIHCLSLIWELLDSQCHLQLHYWTLWEEVPFCGFFRKIRFTWGFRHIVFISLDDQRSYDGRGAQRPILRDTKPKKRGARSARVRTRDQNPLGYKD